MTIKYLIFLILQCSIIKLSVAQDPTLSGGVSCLSPLNLTSTPFSVASSNYLSSDRCAFLSSNFQKSEDGATITLTTSATSCSDVGSNCGSYAVGCAAAASSTQTYYGYYECDMTASGINGTVLSCMVESITRAPYENIYIKLIGNETQRIFTGYFYGGVNYQTGPVTLASITNTLISHKYAFEWTSGHIIWYIDGQIVTSEYGNRPIPTMPNTFVISQTIEQTGYVTDDSSLSTQYIDRNYVPAEDTAAVARRVAQGRKGSRLIFLRQAN
eukprot:TRINITY_DN1029_c0_g1_i2.p1 TRINITY_DN1029_c0_g1~~TRINITY_DN1029_c0_g1_i2.p1  ORF type:complete len:271 (+),score=48.78 TRINITY_DN1029_c0_g1_i2:99-911(+)